MILLTITNKKTCPREFVNTLKVVYKNRFIQFVDLKRLEQIETTIKARYNEKELNLFDICIQAIDNTIIIEDNNTYSLKIDPQARVKTFKVDTIIKFINDGDLESPPYPIFSQISNYIVSNLDSIFQLYSIGVVI